LPDIPSGLRVVNQTFESATAEWTPPADDGGSKVTGYTLEMQEPGSDDWFPVNDVPIKGTSFTSKFIYYQALQHDIFRILVFWLYKIAILFLNLIILIDNLIYSCSIRILKEI
jgi:hypothetical protein